MPADFSGVWQTDLSRSTLRGPVPKSIEVTITHSEPELRQEVVVNRADGTQDRQIFTCHTTGESGLCRLGGQAVRGTACWVGEELLIETWIEAGGREFHFRDFWSLSPDGKTMFMEHRDDDLAGQRAVLHRVHG